MLRLDDIVWESEASDKPVHTKHATKNKGSGIGKRTKIHREQRVLRNSKPAVQGTVTTELADSSSAYGEVASKYQGASLKDLNAQDKQRVAHLIRELAKADEEKENIVHTLHNERQQFLNQVKELENDKLMLLNRQEFLSEEVKQCQTLLQYYQNLITTQQTSVMAQDDSKQLAEVDSPVNHVSLQSSSPTQQKNVSFHVKDDVTGTSADELSSQLDRIHVNGLGYTRNTDSSFTDDQVLRMDDRQYRSYLERKKFRLKQEQERLRKLLEMKIRNSDLSDIEISPVRDFNEKPMVVTEVSDVGSDIVISKKNGSTPFKRLDPSSPIPAAKSRSFYTSIGDHRSPVSKKDSPRTPNRNHNLSQTNMSTKSASSSRLTSTLKTSVSPSLFAAANEGHSELKGSLLRSLPLESAVPSITAVENSTGPLSDAAIAGDLFMCDDSQILQEIFFV